MSLTHRTGGGISCSKYSVFLLGRRKSDNLFLNVPFFYTDYIPVASLPLNARVGTTPENQNFFQKVRRPLSGGTLTTGWCWLGAWLFLFWQHQRVISRLGTQIENKKLQGHFSSSSRLFIYILSDLWARFCVESGCPWFVLFVCKNPADSLSVYVLRYVWKHGPESSGDMARKKGETWILILFEVLGARESAVAADVCLSAHNSIDSPWNNQLDNRLQSDHIPNHETFIKCTCL